MNSMIYNPQEEFDSKFKNLHFENTKKHLEGLVQRSQVDIAQNQKTVKEYETLKENLSKLKRRCNWWRFLRVVMCITLILIPVVIWKVSPKIREMLAMIKQADERVKALLALAYAQMQPLNDLFCKRDALEIIEKTIPGISFAPTFSAQQERDMINNYDFECHDDIDQSTLDVLAGQYNKNPFLFESRLMHKMGTERYHGT